MSRNIAFHKVGYMLANIFSPVACSHLEIILSRKFSASNEKIMCALKWIPVLSNPINHIK